MQENGWKRKILRRKSAKRLVASCYGECEGKKDQKRESCLQHFWASYVNDVVDMEGSTFHTKADLSNAVSVMDKIGGCDECGQEDQIGAEFGAGMWIYTKAVVCNGQRLMEQFMMNKMGLGDSPCGSRVDTTRFLGALESLDYYIEVLCVVQWEMLWYSAPTSLSGELLDHGVRHEQLQQSEWSVWPLVEPLLVLSGEETTQELASWTYKI